MKATTTIAAACVALISVAAHLASGFNVNRDDLWRASARPAAGRSAAGPPPSVADRRWPSRRYYLDQLGGANVLDRKELFDADDDYVDKYEPKQAGRDGGGNGDDSRGDAGDDVKLTPVDIDSDELARAIASLTRLAPALPAKRAFDSIDRDLELKRAPATALGGVDAATAADADQGVLVFGKFAAISPLSKAYPWYEMTHGDPAAAAAAAVAADASDAAGAQQRGAAQK